MTSKATSKISEARYQTATVGKVGGFEVTQSSVSVPSIRTITTTKQTGSVTVRMTTRPSLGLKS